MTTTNTALLVTIEGSKFVAALKAALLAASSDIRIQHINSIHITFPHLNVVRIQATNGRWLWRHDLSAECEQNASETLLTKADVVSIVKAFDKTIPNKLPYLMTIADKRLSLSRGSNQASYQIVCNGGFPPADRIIPKTIGAVGKIALGADYLADICKAFKTVSERKEVHLRMEFTDADSPVKFTDGYTDAVAVLMSVRI